MTMNVSISDVVKTPLDLLDDWAVDWQEFGCMQEAIMCEWLIENGLMPDPTDFGQGNFKLHAPLNFMWYCIDHDVNGKPSDYSYCSACDNTRQRETMNGYDVTCEYCEVKR